MTFFASDLSINLSGRERAEKWKMKEGGMNVTSYSWVFHSVELLVKWIVVLFYLLLEDFYVLSKWVLLQRRKCERARR